MAPEQLFQDRVKDYIKILVSAGLNVKQDRYTETFVRIFVEELKIDFVNDIAFRFGEPTLLGNLPLDNPRNILSNKITALNDREESKDVFDFVPLASAYSFDWDDIIADAKEKQLIDTNLIAKKLEKCPCRS